MWVWMSQRPVGQGGLFHGILDHDDHRWHWAYDCGSMQPRALEREINHVALHGDLDQLFVSHLDTDHINGLDALLGKVDVSEVILPYFDEAALLMIAARETALGRLTGLLISALADLPAWFEARGVKTLTFVDGSEDPGPAEFPPPTSPREGPRGEGPIKAAWFPPAEPLPPDQFGSEAQSIQLQMVTSQASLRLLQGGTTLNWLLLPHVHPADPAKLHAFKQAVLNKFGADCTITEIIRQLRNEEGRKKLRSCYYELWRDHNLISMTLYCGPKDADAFHTAPYPYVGARGWLEPGWLLTGDAHLDVKKRRDALARRYSTVINFIGTLMLPHHGSRLNFDVELIRMLPSLRIAFAAAGPNSYGHPHGRVRRAIKARPWLRFWQVSHKRKKALTLNTRER